MQAAIFMVDMSHEHMLRDLVLGADDLHSAMFKGALISLNHMNQSKYAAIHVILSGTEEKLEYVDVSFGFLRG